MYLNRMFNILQLCRTPSPTEYVCQSIIYMLASPTVENPKLFVLGISSS